jgi:hypothetical protein
VVETTFARHHGADAGAHVATVDAARETAQRDPSAGIGPALITRYLLALSRLCVEVARRPHLLPTFIAIIGKVPGTIIELAGHRRRIAA